MLLLLVACMTKPEGETGADDTSSTVQPTYTAVAEVFTGSCAFSSCHGSSGSPAGQLDLSPENGYAAIVDVPSVEQPSVKLVAPGDSANSYLYQKCANTAGITSDAMPPPSGLDAERLALIQAWIDDGAPNN